MIRTREASWQGTVPEGGGRIALGSGAFEGPFTLSARVEDVERATNPEELIGAAEAGLLHDVAREPAQRGGPSAGRPATTARVRLEQLESGFAITRIELETVGDVPGVDAGDSSRALARAGEGDLPGLPRARRDRDHADATLDAQRSCYGRLT